MPTKPVKTNITGTNLTQGQVKTAWDNLVDYYNEKTDLIGGMKNALINGNFDIWQRGTSFATIATSQYTADRWGAIFAMDSGSGTVTISQQAFTLGQTDVPNEPKYFIRIAGNSFAPGTNGRLSFQQKIEGVRAYAGKTITISFYIKASTTRNIGVRMVQVFGTGGSPSSAINIVNTAVIPMTTAFVKKEITLAIPSITGKALGSDNNDCLVLAIDVTAKGTSNPGYASDIPNLASDSIDIAQVQIEEGTTSTPFEKRHIQQELALCKRYFERLALALDSQILFAFGQAYSATTAFVKLDYISKRVAPLISFVNPTSFTLASAVGGGLAVSSFGASTRISTNNALLFPVVAGSLVAGNATMLTTDTNGEIWIDAEL